MKKALLILGLIFITIWSHAQDEEGYYFHTFKIENITTDGDAKHMIGDMRDKTGEKIFYFDDETDIFTLKTKHVYTTNEFYDILRSHHFNVIAR